MATTTNYGWTTPDDTSLVKDGASAIRTLGSSIDTSLNNALGTKKAGLVLLNTTSFSAVASQSLPSGTFSATYENYRIILDLTAVSASQDITLRLRTTAGSDATTNYTNPIRVFDSGGGSGNFISTTSWKVMETRSGSNNHFYSVDMNLHSPFLSIPTTYTMTSISRASDGSSKSAYGGGMHEDATSYSSLSILANTGNITGKVYIYGYNL
jgi:hypothetical protein